VKEEEGRERERGDCRKKEMSRRRRRRRRRLVLCKVLEYFSLLLLNLFVWFL
jgi:hypothetical protein